ncbi:MAG: triose-phosphate isomerase [Pseudohongiellaceae bacterium]
MRQRLVVGNWKMHGTIDSVKTLVNGITDSRLEFKEGVRMSICPSFVHLLSAGTWLQNWRHQQSGAAISGTITLGAQDVSTEWEDGAFTGEVSAAMLKDLGVSQVIVGHSERRQHFAETDAIVAAKFKAVQHHGMVPILCLGESLAQREADETAEVVLAQLRAVTDVVGMEAMAKAVIAYEPVWAIGTGVTATPEQAQEVHRLLRDALCQQDSKGSKEKVGQQLPILYGGSVKAANAAELFRQPDIDGALVGGASLQAEEFVSICVSLNESADS